MKAFRWNGPGTLTDFVGKPPKAVEHLGRREDARGKIVEGDIVREHTVDPKKLDEWVKAGMAEYVNLAQNVADKLGGSKQNEESKRESEHLQAVADQADVTVRLASLSEIRRVMNHTLFTDAERAAAEKEFPSIPSSRLPEVLADTKAELERRQKAEETKTAGAAHGRGKGKTPADAPAPDQGSLIENGGAGPKTEDAPAEDGSPEAETSEAGK